MGLGDGQATGGPSNRADEREWVKRVEGAERLVG